MAAYHVFVDGSIDDSPMGLKDLATAIASHYGLNAADLLPRLQKGRFRVKTNADEATAAAYKRDLERLGAVCTIEEATPANSQRTTPIPFPAVRPATPPAGLPTVKSTTPPPTGLAAAGTTTPPANRANTPASGLAAAGTTTPPANRANTPASGLAAAGTTTPPANRANTPASGLAAAGSTIPPTNRPAPPSALAAAGATTPPPMGGQQFQSGLSAAFSGEMPAADLGALGGDALSVSSLDGVDDKPEAAASFGPPSGGGLPASIGPAPDKADKKDAKGKKDKPKDEPLDMFAPPDMQGDEFKVDIAADEADFARKRSSTPPPMATINDGPPPPEKASSQKIPTTPAARKSQPSLQVPNEPVAVVASVPSKLGPLGDERVRFAAGVLLAVLLGFVPAHFVAKMKEDSATEMVDRKVVAAQQTADTPELYANLDRMRADQLDRKKSEHRNAAIIGFAVWALVGGGIAFAWFKKIPWDG